MRDFLALALQAAEVAGAAVMQHYETQILVEHKTDGSPVTVADLEADRAIKQVLAPSGFVIVSEEGVESASSTEAYWLIDPLDGTKDFLAGTGEFTINIALVEQGVPKLGVVLAPAQGDTFWGVRGSGAWRIRGGMSEKMTQAPASLKQRMVVSRSENPEELQKFATENGIAESISVGSALKYCLLAAAEFEVFPRLVGSSEWDTGAGQAVLEASGGHVVEWDTGKPLEYGKPKRRNPRLLAFRSPYNFDDFKREMYREVVK